MFLMYIYTYIIIYMYIYIYINICVCMNNEGAAPRGEFALNFGSTRHPFEPIALFRDGAIHIINVQYFHSKGYLKPVGGHPPIAHVVSLFRL